jgi:hypothetical protein
METSQLRIRVPVVLDEEALVEKKIKRILAIGHNKSLTREQRIEKITAILLEGQEEEEEKEAEEEEEEEEEEEQEEAEEEGQLCHTCGNECVSYTIGYKQISWLCEKCYYGEKTATYANEIGLDWNESGYMD